MTFPLQRYMIWQENGHAMGRLLQTLPVKEWRYLPTLALVRWTMSGKSWNSGATGVLRKHAVSKKCVREKRARRPTMIRGKGYEE